MNNKEYNTSRGTETAEQLIDAALLTAVSHRRHLHMYPELSGEEKETAAYVREVLKKLDIEVRDNIFGYGLLGIIYGKDRGRAIALRADMDALPVTEDNDLPFRSKTKGVMHACGHDVHTAVLLGTAQVLSEIRDSLPLSVVLIFQPSEETVGGARQMIEAGCLLDPEVCAVLGLHIDPSENCDKVIMVPGTMNAATSEFRVKVNGRSCHGAHPDQGVDPLIPACNMVIALQSILTRRIYPADSCLITVGRFNSGTKENVIPDYSRFSGTIRVLDMYNLPKIQEELRRLCSGIAEAHAASCEIEFDNGYPTLVNDSELLEKVARAYRASYGNDSVVICPKPSLGADDFAFFCHETKALYYDIGAKSPGQKPMSLHSSELTVDERCIKTGIRSEICGIMALMEE